MSRKLFAVVLALSLVLAIIPACGTAYADPVLSEKYAANQFEAHPDFSDEPADSPYHDEKEWECGDGVSAHYWAGELAIESNGEGIIDDYDNADHPWKDYEKYITRLNVYGDLKYIGNEAFADLINLQ